MRYNAWDTPERRKRSMAKKAFQDLIRRWYRRNGRHDLPWRHTRDPYHILVSEVMLQQTQVSRVIPKYEELLRAFPTVQALNRSPLAAALRLWQGMGYNRRALLLKRLAGIVSREHGGRIPADSALLAALPGAGPATAGAVLAFAFGKRTAFLETNIRRVFLHYFFRGRRRVRDREILAKIQATLPKRNIREWYWALMDHGALALKGTGNPNRRSAGYARQPPFAGSRRQARGRIISMAAAGGVVSERKMLAEFKDDRTLKRYGSPRAFRGIIRDLARDGLIARQGSRITLHR